MVWIPSTEQNLHSMESLERNTVFPRKQGVLLCFLLAANVPLLSYGRTAASSSSSSFPSRIPRSTQSATSKTDGHTSSSRQDYSAEDWWQDAAGTGGGASSDDEDESESESSSDEEDWNRLSALAQATIEEAERRSLQQSNNNLDHNKLQLSEKSSVSSSNARLSKPSEVLKTQHRTAQRSGSKPSTAASNFQPMQTLNKLQQMLDDSDYITSNRERSNGSNNGHSKRFLMDDSKIDSTDESFPAKLWTSKDRAKYKRQQNRIRGRTSTSESPADFTVSTQLPSPPQEQPRPPIEGSNYSPSKTNLTQKQPYTRPSPPIQFSSDDENSEEEDLGYSLPNLPVYYSDGEESDASDDESAGASGSHQPPIQYPLPYSRPEQGAQQRERQPLPPPNTMQEYPQNYHPWQNGQHPPPQAQGHPNYGPPPNMYYLQQLEYQQAHHSQHSYPSGYMMPQQHQQQQQQQGYCTNQQGPPPYWSEPPPPPRQPVQSQHSRPPLPASAPRPGSLSMPKRASIQPIYSHSTQEGDSIRHPSSRLISTNDSRESSNPEGPRGVPGFQYMQEGYTPVTIFMPPESLDDERSHAMSFASFQKVGLVLLTLTLGCYSAVSPRHLPLAEYNLRFYENLGLLSLAAVAPILYSILVIAPRENDVNDIIHTFFTSFSLGYVLSFLAEIMATTVVRLVVFSWFEPKIFSLTPKVPVPIIPWVLRETGYRPKRITLLAAEIAAAVIICPILEEYIKLCVVRWTVLLKKNFSWVKKTTGPPSRTKAHWTSEPIVRPPNEPDIVTANQYITQFLAASLGMKFADSCRRILLFTKPSDPSKSLYAVCRGLFPLQELTGTITALGLAKRDLLGVKTPTWKLLLPAIVIHGMANFRGKKPIYRWGSCTPWSEMQLPAFHVPDSSPLPKLLSKGFAKIMWFVIIIRVIGYCAKNYYMINRQAIKRTTTYAGKPAAFSAKLTTSELLKKK